MDCECILCGCEISKVKEPKCETIKEWDKRSASSLCQILFKSKPEKLIQILSEGDPCQECKQKMWDLNLAYQAIQKLHNQISTLTQSIVQDILMIHNAKEDDKLVIQVEDFPSLFYKELDEVGLLTKDLSKFNSIILQNILSILDLDKPLEEEPPIEEDSTLISNLIIVKQENMDMDFEDETEDSSFQNYNDDIESYGIESPIASPPTPSPTNTASLKPIGRYLQLKMEHFENVTAISSSLLCLCPVMDCMKKSKSASALQSHIKRAHPEGIECPECNKKFPFVSVYQKHARVHLKALKMTTYLNQCPVCHIKYVQDHRCLSRWAKYSPTTTTTTKLSSAPKDKPQKRYKCFDCSKNYKQSKNLKQHMMTAPEHKIEYQSKSQEYCGFCNKGDNDKEKSFSCKLDLRVHQLYEHRQEFEIENPYRDQSYQSAMGFEIVPNESNNSNSNALFDESIDNAPIEIENSIVKQEPIQSLEFDLNLITGL